MALCACTRAATGGPGQRPDPRRERQQEGGWGPRRRLCVFGFDLPGDELIPPYNRLREIGKMAAVLSPSPWGPSRARGRGASLEKYSLCRRRVSLTERRTAGTRARVSYHTSRVERLWGLWQDVPPEAG